MLLVIINLLESQDKNKRLFSKKVTKQKKNFITNSEERQDL
jgi:hypothetical protein